MKLLSIKKASFLLFVCALSACKKENGLPEIGNINASSNKIAVGQYITLKSITAKGDAMDREFDYNWTGTDGFKSTEAEASWVPSKNGNQTITLTLSSGKKSTSKSASFNVVEPNFRLGLWGNTRSEIQLYESKAGNELISSNGEFMVYIGENSMDADGYVINNNALIGAATVYTERYSTNYMQYVNDYNNYLSKLIAKYGTPKTNMLYYKTEAIRDELKTYPNRLGDMIINGDVRLQAVWSVADSDIAITIYKNETLESLIFGTTYSPVSIKTTASTLDNKAQTALEELTKYQINRRVNIQ